MIGRGADKGYDAKVFINELRLMEFTRQVIDHLRAQRQDDGRTLSRRISRTEKRARPQAGLADRLGLSSESRIWEGALLSHFADRTIDRLRRYLAVRALYGALTEDAALFLSAAGGFIAKRRINKVPEASHQPWLDRAGGSWRGAHSRPAPHIRRRIQLWHEHGADIDNAMVALSTYVGHAEISDTYWYLTGVPELMAVAGKRFKLFASTVGGDHHDGSQADIVLPQPASKRFFVEHLGNQRALSSPPSPPTAIPFDCCLTLPRRRLEADLNAQLILSFLDHLEKERSNCARTRNARLAALHSFLKYAAHYDLTALPVIEQVLAIPMKWFDRPVLGFLSREEMQAILEAPDARTWAGERDRTLFRLMYNIGARASEAIGLRVGEVVVDASAVAHLHGKGAKIAACRSGVRPPT
ncbi:tyrosine-type recombinase/integrase [Sinorhizobium meliloti]|uniref:tyrosine-type recombinase/integrase n=1 Tax=Rhizobium meliloti TaxID=382 RepID=UPI0006ACAC48|nr:tyrosine-type recombinase/integrase [Sinorhizobium meliloti]